MSNNTKPRYKLEFLAQAKEDYDKLGGAQLIFVDKGLNRIRFLGMTAGAPLHGPLESCHKLKNRKMGLRIVFTQREQKIQIIQIIAIGKRRRNEVYDQAFLRLEQDQQQY